MFIMLTPQLTQCLNCNIASIVLEEIENSYYNTKDDKCCNCEDLKLLQAIQYLIKFSQNTECKYLIDISCFIKC